MRFLVLLQCYFLSANIVLADEAAWQNWLDGTAVVIMRHTLAPGTGDPMQFQLADCTTQRNLNQVGRQQAQQWGQLLLKFTAQPIKIYSSQWCRCLETARLMAVGDVNPLPMLNSFFAGRGQANEQTAALQDYFSMNKLSQPTVLVTHQVNITALTGIFPASGEAIIVALPLTQPANILAVILP